MSSRPLFSARAKPPLLKVTGVPRKPLLRGRQAAVRILRQNAAVSLHLTRKLSAADAEADLLVCSKQSGIELHRGNENVEDIQQVVRSCMWNQPSPADQEDLSLEDGDIFQETNKLRIEEDSWIQSSEHEESEDQGVSQALADAENALRDMLKDENNASLGQHVNREMLDTPGIPMIRQDESRPLLSQVQTDRIERNRQQALARRAQAVVVEQATTMATDSGKGSWDSADCFSSGCTPNINAKRWEGGRREIQVRM